MSDCPQCQRPAPVATYTCKVPGCLEAKFCCPACICEHMGEHVRERDERIERLRGERDRAFDLLAEFTDWTPGQGVLPQRSPGHGPCCTCQACGHHHDECVCEHNAIQLGLEGDDD